MSAYRIKADLQLEKGFSSKFKAQIELEINRKISRSIFKVTQSMEFAIQNLVRAKLNQSPTVNELSGGRLRAELGLVDGAARISNIINTWAESIEVKYVKKLSTFGGIVVSMQSYDYSNVLSMPEAEFVTEKGVVLEWLRWLLLEGSGRIISNHFFKPTPRGRTGGGIMVERQTSSWSVPKNHAGTSSDNFATRALEGIQDEIDVIVRREMTKVV
jgi:hypothetical protein